MQQLILEAFSNHVEDKVATSSQHGFTKGKLCLTNLIAFYDGTTGWIDEGRAGDIAYPDFSEDCNTLPWHPHRQAQEVLAGWMDDEGDRELAEWQVSQSCGQWRRV